MRFQKKVLILSHPGVFWRMKNPAQLDESREDVCTDAHSHNALVIEKKNLYGHVLARC